MTEPCLDTDALVSVASALEWAVPERLDHLAACERCRTRLSELAEFRSELTAAIPAPELDAVPVTASAGAGLATVMPPLAAKDTLSPAAGATRPRPAAPRVATATFLTAGATALLVIMLLAGNPPAPLALAVAGLAGLASIAPIRPRRQDA